MLFNSIDFALFVPIVFVLYWFVTDRNLKVQNGLLLIASYVFYAWWDWRFLSLILFSSMVDYLVGIGLSRSTRSNDKSRRKLLLFISIFVNLGFLGFFKYFNFFSENFVEAFRLFGFSFEVSRLNIILPIGISFYTFQTLSYSIDVYRGRVRPAKDIISYFAYVSFFPQLVAGPIERATSLLPQFYKKREFKYSNAADGLRQILWGLFKKMVIADNCAEFANLIFESSGDQSGSVLFLGAVFFAFQIYGDFSGYSDIAIGTARLFGFKLMQNFAFPYFSRDIAEFWRRWHISLSTWFRDYLYIPLGGSRGSTKTRVRNVFIIFIVSGFWHGANWTFILWGILNAVYFLPLMLSNRNRVHLKTVASGKMLPSVRELLLMITTFTLTVFAWVFFRADNIGHAFQYIGGIFSSSLASIPYISEPGTGISYLPKTILVLLTVFILVEWYGREEQYAIARLGMKWLRPLRYLMYCIIVIAILWFGGKEQEFIYFQF